MQQEGTLNKRSKGKGGGENSQSINKAWRAARHPIGWKVGPTMVLVCIVHMMLQVALSVIKFHLSMKQLVLILSMLLLPLIDSVKPQLETGELIAHILIEFGGIKT